MQISRLSLIALLLLVSCGGPGHGGDAAGESDGSDDPSEPDSGDEGSQGSGGDGADGADGGGDGGTGAPVRSDIPSVAVCDGARLLAPPGGFLCTDTALPETTHFALLEVEGSPAAVLIPVLEQDGQFVTIAPLLADVYGVWSGDVQLNLYDHAGAQLASVDAGIALSSAPVTDAERTLSEWQEGISSAWARHPNPAGRTVADMYQQLAGLYAYSLEETFAPVRWNDVPIEMDTEAGEAVARAIAQHRTELAAAGISGSWNSLDPGLVRGTHVFLPSAIFEPDASRDGLLFVWPAAVALATVVEVSIAGYMVAETIEAAVDRITRAGEECRAGLCGLDPFSPTPPPSATSDCMTLNTDDPRARALGNSIPGEEEVRDIPEGEVYYDCIDEVDNDGDGLVDCFDEGCLGYYGCDIDWSGRYQTQAGSGRGAVNWGEGQVNCGFGSFTVEENVVQSFEWLNVATLFSVRTGSSPISAFDTASLPLWLTLGSSEVLLSSTIDLTFGFDSDGTFTAQAATSGFHSPSPGTSASWDCSWTSERQ